MALGRSWWLAFWRPRPQNLAGGRLRPLVPLGTRCRRLWPLRRPRPWWLEGGVRAVTPGAPWQPSVAGWPSGGPALATRVDRGGEKEPRAPRQTSKWLAFWRPRPGLAVGDGVVGPSWRQLEVLQAGHMKETTEGGGRNSEAPQPLRHLELAVLLRTQGRPPGSLCRGQRASPLVPRGVLGSPASLLVLTESELRGRGGPG